MPKNRLKQFRTQSAYRSARGLVTLIIVAIGLILAVRLIGDIRVVYKLPDTLAAERARILFADAVSLVALLPVLWLVWFFLQLLIDIADNLLMARIGYKGDTPDP